MTTDTKTRQRDKVVIKPPATWQVVVFDDEQTPMQLVIEIIMVIFNYEEEEAVELTLEVHNAGSAVVGVYSHEIAEHKAYEAVAVARANGYPLMVKAVTQ